MPSVVSSASTAGGQIACASCHVPSSNFLDRQAHDIGSVAAPYQGARSGALDTPTLLGSRFTAPYFHDGSLPTLASVVDWFDGRYGLALSEAERSDLTAYLEAVGDPATGLPIGSTAQNLKAAIAGETHEYTDMYPGMAKTAREEGFEEIADWFETLAKAERSHANRFQKALDAMR